MDNWSFCTFCCKTTAINLVKPFVWLSQNSDFLLFIFFEREKKSKNFRKFQIIYSNRRKIADFSVTILRSPKAHQFCLYWKWEEISEVLPFYLRNLLFRVFRIQRNQSQINWMETQNPSCNWNLIFRSNFWPRKNNFYK